MSKKLTGDGFEVDRHVHPSYYNWMPNIEANDVAQHLNFNLGNAFKYIYRCGHKGENGVSSKDKKIEDLKKAIVYLEFEVQRVENFE